jgi:hypothetical protein
MFHMNEVSVVVWPCNVSGIEGSVSPWTANRKIWLKMHRSASGKKLPRFSRVAFGGYSKGGSLLSSL